MKTVTWSTAGRSPIDGKTIHTPSLDGLEYRAYNIVEHSSGTLTNIYSSNLPWQSLGEAKSEMASRVLNAPPQLHPHRTDIKEPTE